MDDYRDELIQTDRYTAGKPTVINPQSAASKQVRKSRDKYGLKKFLNQGEKTRS